MGGDISDSEEEASEAPTRAGGDGRSSRPSRNSHASDGITRRHAADLLARNDWIGSEYIHTNEGVVVGAPPTMLLRGGGPERRQRSPDNQNRDEEYESKAQKRRKQVDTSRSNVDEANGATETDGVSYADSVFLDRGSRSSESRSGGVAGGAYNRSPNSYMQQQSSGSNVTTSSSNHSQAHPYISTQQQLPALHASATTPMDNALLSLMPHLSHAMFPSVAGLPPSHQHMLVNAVPPPPPGNSVLLPSTASQVAQFILQQNFASQPLAYPTLLIPQGINRGAAFHDGTAAARVGGIPRSTPLIPQDIMMWQQAQQAYHRLQPPPSMRMLSNPSDAISGSQHLPTATGSAQQDSARSRIDPGTFPPLTTIAPPGLLMFLPIDSERLSDYQVLVRKHIEYFEATDDDVSLNVQGRKKQLHIGQVGLRCIHCYKVLPLNRRRRGSVYFPMKLIGLYQAAQNIATTHLSDSCICIPTSIKSELNRLREFKVTAGGGKKYWANAGEAKGIYETEEGLRLRHDNDDGGDHTNEEKEEEEGGGKTE